MDKVLIVEDTLSEMELLSHYLREEGYAVIGTANAKEALQMALDHKPDVIVSDVVMPGMSGFEFCRSLRKNPETSTVPVILCTSKSQDIDRLWGMKQGANAYITKPFTREVLLQTIQTVKL
ncbi:response regulator [Alkalinema pantanalense CENA528]|uniref:response regulator n=1 Tax=Alkalinema pantanalense TaxID=1620705 RepID=UPI003D6EDFEF